MSDPAVPPSRHLNGPQTTGRHYTNLSEPQHAIVTDRDVAMTLRDGTRLRVDVHRPAAPGRYPALLAASLYPRQLQDLGAPMGFIEAGATDFWVARGYVHVIANLRGTSGSEGTFSMSDGQERQDMYDLVEWTAAQDWCDGNVGGLGISYFATAQLAAAAERPPHLKAIFPLAASPDLYDEVRHHGLFSSTIISPFMSNVGIVSDPDKNHWWTGRAANLLRRLLHSRPVHDRLATFNGESAVGALKLLRKFDYAPVPWDALWYAMAVEHPLRDAWWDARSMQQALREVTIPVYLGCDWENVPLHLPGTFAALDALGERDTVRVALMGRFGLTWPWESMHEEALAWFDHWLKGHDTGILAGPRIRYWLPGADEWRSSDCWPPAESRLVELALRADGRLATDAGPAGSRSYVCLGSGLARERRPSDPVASLVWETEALSADLDMVGNLELRLDAAATAMDTAWIAVLQDVAPDGTTTDVTAGWLQASLREVDEAASRPGAPVLPCRRAQPVPIGETVAYRIPIVANARRFVAGHRLRLILCSDDQPADIPAIMGFRHAPVGTSSHNTIHASSRLLLPIVHGNLR